MHTSQQELNISKLFSHPVQYKVPHYQRRYIWNKTNWRTLWEDILAQLGLELKEELDDEYTFEPLERHEETLTSPRQSDNKKHFTGIIVTRQIGDGEPEIFEVIDGQQRLTTFQIILCVIRDIFASKSEHVMAKPSQMLIMNENNIVQLTGQETTYKFRPTKFDSLEFEAVANKEYGEFISELAFDEETNRLRPEIITDRRNEFTDSDNHNILDAYDYFYELTMVYIHRNKDKDWKRELSELLITIRTQLKVVLTTLDNSDHSEKIFESINATGRKLAEFDYLRNNLFLRAKQLDDPKKEESDSDRFLRDFWPFENSHSYWSVDQLESFLRVFLIAKLGPYCFQSGEQDEKDRKKAFEVYQKSYYNKVRDKAIKDDFTPTEKVKYEFSELNRYSEAYRKADFNDPEFAEQSDRIRSHMKFYDDLNMTSLLPFILYLQYEANQTIDQLEIVFKILESYLMRRMVWLGNGLNDKDEDAYKNIYGYFSKLIKGDKNPKFDIKEFVQSLNEWPNGSINENLQKIAGQIDEIKASRTKVRYIFYRIERKLTEESGLSFKDFSHYNPVRIASKQELQVVFYGYNRMSASDWEELDRYYDGMGNITFLRTSQINSDEINSDKVIILSFEGTKEILSKFPDVNLKLDRKISQLRAWRRSSIIERRKEIYQHFRAIWPNQDWFLKEISRQTHESEKGVEPTEKTISLPKTRVVTTPKTVEKQDSKLKEISRQTHESEKGVEPTEKTISLPKTRVVTTPKTVEKQDSKLKTCRGKVKLWMGSYGYIESSDLEARIEVNISDFQDRTAANPVQQEQKVKFEIDQTQSGKNLKPINLVRIKE